ncbi:MFS transporter [Vibrio sp. D404a]|uniref:MFS transporter n=1 Tax=unclassified Vibrio TaxID=2614977 RepID=UPI002555D475|nr:MULTISPECIES: MFS transporter [unclassified Vibrio]MDK9736421.1 MFS transporter [Vibrio sp. D404a]MDK9796043.1 MFS transporter [Vibrio sp. D449a]
MNTLAESQGSIWKNRTFITLFSSALFVSFASQIYTLALPLLVYELTQSSEWMGWMRAVEFLPNLLLALFIGVWVDRSDKKQWSLMMLLGQAITVLVSYLAVEYLAQPLWLLFPCAFLMMAFNYGYHNARMTIQKSALPHDSQNVATARMSSLGSFMETVGPVMSGAIMLLATIHNVFIGVAALMLLAFWQLRKLDITTKPNRHKQSTFGALKEGWQALRQAQQMWLITLAVMVINTTGAVFWIQAIYYAKADLELNSVGVSYLIVASGVGGLIGAFSADKLRRKWGLGWLLIISIGLESLGFLIPLIAPHQVALIAGFFWVSAVGLYSSICIWSYRQETFDENVLGRVTGITGSLFKLLMPIGLAGSGYLTTLIGIKWVFIGCFVLQLLTAVWLMTTSVRTVR